MNNMKYKVTEYNELLQIDELLLYCEDYKKAVNHAKLHKNAEIWEENPDGDIKLFTMKEVE